MSKIGLFELNNYFNRKIIKLDRYLQFTAQSKAYAFYDNINFNPNDDVSAELVLNFEPEDIKPDYLVEFTDDLLPMNMRVISRWFVIDAVRTLAGQYKMRLRRDVIADNYDGVLSADCFIEKATLNDDDPLVANDEGMSFNQIKKEEILLKDKSKTAWLVGYIPKNIASFSVTYTENPPTSFVTEAQLASKTGIPQTVISNLLSGNTNVRAFTSNATLRYLNRIYYNYQGLGQLLSWARFRLHLSNDISSVSRIASEMPLNDSGGWESLYRIPFQGTQIEEIVNAREVAESFGQALLSSGTLQSEMQSALNSDGLLNSVQLNALKAMTGKVVYRDNAYYTITVTTGDYHELSNKSITGRTVPSIATALNSLMQSSAIDDMDDSARIEVDGETCRITVTLTPYTTTGTYSATLTGGEGNNTPGRPYRIFAMPYDDIRVVVNLVGVNSKGSICRGIAGKLQMGTTDSDSNPAYLYDLQLLPYCPFPDNIETDSDGPLVIFPNNTPSSNYTFIKDGDNNNVGVIFYIDDDSFSTFIDTQLSLDDSMKVDSNCDMWRICSPNYQGSFEFNVAKNGGSVSGFTAYCTYKPYTPFIRVAPDFHFLYGSEFGDMRGLICGGDFSLPSADNAWNTYQLNNKNYQNIFNREIQNLSFSQNIEMRNQVISSAVGVLGDTVKGAAAGSSGGPWGAIAGAVVGGASSIAGAVVDTYTLGAVHKEQRDFAIDRFNYTIGNVKALPYTITKVGSWDISSKIWPFLEHYQCSEQEREAFKEKIRLDGMTVMRIGKIRDYIKGEPTYIKAEMIRSDDISGDSHIYMAIYEELRKGVYI